MMLLLFLLGVVVWHRKKWEMTYTSFLIINLPEKNPDSYRVLFIWNGVVNVPNAAGNPKIKEYGKNTRFGTERGCSPVEAGAKGNEVQAAKRSWRQTMEEAATPEVKEEIIDVLIEKARSGSLDAIKLYLEWTEQKPSTKMDINANIPVVIVDDIPEPEESI